MDKQELEYLLKNYFQDSLQPDEERRLVKMLTEDPSEELLEQFDIYYHKYSSSVPFPSEQKQKIWEDIVKSQPKIKTGPVWKNYMTYVAVLVCVILGAVTYTIKFSKTPATFDSFHTAEEETIYLKNYAEPLLSIVDENGASKELTDSERKRLGLAMDNDNALQIRSVSSLSTSEGARLKVHTRKGQIQHILLPDGSNVWLNSNSELNLPLTFASDIRKVRLEGEAYFEVASREKHPFHVMTAHNTIEVLGTHFNTAAYGGEVEKTTLLEGSVRVFNDDNIVLLKPGEQAYGNKELDRRKVDIERAMAWKLGDFYFDDLSIKELMDIVYEWYDVKFVTYEYQGRDRFSGTFKKANSLEELLRNLEEVSSIRFNIKEGGVYVLKK